jgi:RNA polymerase sigma factor (sigma-70 family)
MDEAARFRAGEPAAIARVSRLVAAVVHSRGFFIPAGERVEVIQAAMVQLWDAMACTREAEPRDFPAFVRAVAYRRCVDWMRRHRRTEPVRLDAAAPTPDPEAALLADEEVRIGRWVLETLDARCRELIRMHSEEEMTFREIAESQGRLEKTVRNQMSKCLAKARDLIDRMRRRERLGLHAFRGVR